MGLSIHYSGSIAKPELLPGLIEEIQDIAKMYDWKYKVYELQFPKNSFGKPGYDENIYGISFTPPECETIPICFLSNGRMSDNARLMFYGKTDEQQENEYLYMLSVKTQYAGVESHQFIIQLFRYLNTKYFADFKMTDEGNYWETNDEVILKANFKKYNDLKESFVSGLENYPMQPGENIESYFKRMMAQIHGKKK